jgi:hypothetical protein
VYINVPSGRNMSTEIEVREKKQIKSLEKGALLK